MALIFHRSRFLSYQWRVFLTLIALALAASGVTAQQNDSQVIPTPTPTQDYLLGPSDTLSISVKDMPEMDWMGEVLSDGTITLPFIDKPIAVSCRTIDELVKDIKSEYGKFLKKQNEIAVKLTNRSSRSPIRVSGAIKTLVRVSLLRRNVRLPELLTAVGGLTEKAGKTIVIVPTEKPLCGEGGLLRQNVEVGWPLFYPLDEAISADEKRGLVILPGDIIAILESQMVYVVGMVNTPSGFAFTEGLTLLQAIEKAGGFYAQAKLKGISVRRSENGAKTEIKVNWDAIKAGREKDITLLPNDVIAVQGIIEKMFPREIYDCHSFGGNDNAGPAQLFANFLDVNKWPSVYKVIR